MRVIRWLGCLFLFVILFFVGMYWHYAHLVEKELTSTKPLPTSIYASSLTLQKGIALSRSDLIAYLQSLDYLPAETANVRSMQYYADANRLRFASGKPGIRNSSDRVLDVVFDGGGISRISDSKSGKEIHSLQMAPIPIRTLAGKDWEKQEFVPYKDFPKVLIDSVITTEDRRFFHHFGLDFIGIARALFRNLTSSDELQGGSTITQQLAKNFFLTPERSINRKITEAILALMIEHRRTKEQILELYLNEIYMGQRGAMSIHGMGEASRIFFHKDIQAINVSEAAILAGMISAPNALNPSRNVEQAQARRNLVLKGMLEEKQITRQQFERFEKMPVHAYPTETSAPLAPYFAEVALAELHKEMNDESLKKQSVQVFSTLDLEMQDAAESSLANGLQAIDSEMQSVTHKKVQGCLIAVDPKTGAIKALVGGRDYSTSQFNRIQQAMRQAGSVFKPVVYAAAIEQRFAKRDSYTPATLVDDDPWVLKTEKDTWEPKNYDNMYHGMVTLREALAESMNVATAKLAADVGFDKVAAYGKKMGFEDVKDYPSIALGAFEVTPWQVASAYQIFANGGVKETLHTIQEIHNEKGSALDRGSKLKSEKIMRPQTAFFITDMMKSVITEGTASSMSSFGFKRPVAGKTGTSNDFHDAWFAGYTPDLVCVLWVGYDDSTSLGKTASDIAVPIWADFMRKATAKTSARDFAVPAGVVAVLIDPTTGKLATPECPETHKEYFIQGTQPTELCEEHGSTLLTYNDEDRDPPQRRRVHKRKWWEKLKFWN